MVPYIGNIIFRRCESAHIRFITKDVNVRHRPEQKKGIQNRTMHKGMLLGRHIYTRIEPVFIEQMDALKDAVFMNNTVYCNGTAAAVSVERFLDDLISFYSGNTVKRAHVLEKLRIMIPLKCGEEKYTELFKSVMETIKNIENCPVFSVIERKGKCTYMDIYISEREYYPEGEEHTEHYTSDWYRDPKTGRRCAGDKPGAVLEHKKGDVRSRAVTKFSNKKNVLRLTRGEFIELKRNLIRAINNFCDKYALDPRVLMLKHLDYDKVSTTDKRLRIHCACFNAYIAKIEQEITKCYRYMTEVGIEDIKNAINKFCMTFFKKAGDGFSGTYKTSSKNFSWHIDLSGSWNYLVQNLELMFMEFDRRFRKMITDNYIPAVI